MRAGRAPQACVYTSQASRVHLMFVFTRRVALGGQMGVDEDDRFDELAQWLVDGADNAGNSVGVGRPELIHTWRSRTATLHHFSWPAANLPDVVVKLHRTAEEANAHFRSMCQVARALEDANQRGVAVINPFDVSVGLKAVSMPFVAGDSLSNRLFYGDWSSEASRDDLRRLVHRCGSVLGSYHSKQPRMDHNVRQQAADRLDSRIERALEREVDLTSVAASGPVVKCYGDFHPGHIIVTSDRKLALIDPPMEVRYDYFYRDLARFSYSLFMTLLDPRGMVRNPLRVRQRGSMTEAFLEGYATATNRTLTNDDLFYIHGWEAFYLARTLRKLRRGRSYGLLAYYYYVPIRNRLRILRRTLTRHLKHAGRRAG